MPAAGVIRLDDCSQISSRHEIRRHRMASHNVTVARSPCASALPRPELYKIGEAFVRRTFTLLLKAAGWLHGEAARKTKTNIKIRRTFARSVAGDASKCYALESLHLLRKRCWLSLATFSQKRRGRLFTSWSHSGSAYHFLGSRCSMFWRCDKLG